MAWAFLKGTDDNLHPSIACCAFIWEKKMRTKDNKSRETTLIVIPEAISRQLHSATHL